MWPEKINSAPSWLVSSVGRALHRYRRGHGFNSRIEPFIEDRFYIRISIIVIISIRHLFIYSFIFSLRVPSNLFQKLLLLFFEKHLNLKEFGIETSVLAPTRKVIQSPQKLRKNGSLSIGRFKSVVLGILVRGTLVQRRKAGFGLG